MARMKQEQGSAGLVSWHGTSGPTMTCSGTEQHAMGPKGPHIHHHLTWAGSGDSAALWLGGRLAAVYNRARLHRAEGTWPATALARHTWPCSH